jgi:long-chain acyl-CoA synthetase
VDVTPFTKELRIAPTAVFDRLPTHGDRPRFMLPKPDGTWTPVTWNAFADEIRAVALFLIGSEMKSGDRVAIFAPNRVEWASAALGVEAAGCVMVPIYPASTAEQAAYIVNHADARVLFVDTPALLARVFDAWFDMPALEKVVVIDASIDAAAVLARPAAQGQKARPTLVVAKKKLVTFADATASGRALHARDGQLFERTMSAVSIEKPAIMLYTSGTSGNPKGVPLTHQNVGMNGRDWLECNAMLLEEGMVDVLWLPMSHIFGFGELCLGNTLGFTTYLSEPQHVLQRLPELAPSVFMSVPSHWEKIAIAAAEGTSSESEVKAKLEAITGGRLRFCLSGGAGLKREVKELFYKSGVLIIEGYGLTECSPTLTLNRPNAFRFDSVGKALPSVELRLAEDGEILARGPNVFEGYHKDDAATKEAFTSDGWFKTGDVGRTTEDGFLQIVDRKKDILVTAGGKNVPPANIEVRFRDDPKIGHVVVYGEGKRYLVAGVWPHVATKVTPELHAHVAAAIAKVNGEVAHHETLKKYVLFDAPLTVESGLLTASMKVRRKEVYGRHRDAFEALYDDAATATLANAGVLAR